MICIYFLLSLFFFFFFDEMREQFSIGLNANQFLDLKRKIFDNKKKYNKTIKKMKIFIGKIKEIKRKSFHRLSPTCRMT